MRRVDGVNGSSLNERSVAQYPKMFTFIIKDNGTELNVITTRAMLALAAIATVLYRSDECYYLNLVLSVALVITAVFIRLLMTNFRISKFVLLSAAAVILLIVTHSIAFAVILMIFGYLVRFLYQKPTIEITSEGITIKKLFSRPAYQWNEFSNIILKDSLLTLDFKNNKLMQVIIDENEKAVDENAFNDFCRDFI
ncbi:MAG: hypothetical protein ABI760_13695 [Ferruginibacter sp.]